MSNYQITLLIQQEVLAAFEGMISFIIVINNIILIINTNNKC